MSHLAIDPDYGLLCGAGDVIGTVVGALFALKVKRRQTVR